MKLSIERKNSEGILLKVEKNIEDVDIKRNEIDKNKNKNKNENEKKD